MTPEEYHLSGRFMGKAHKTTLTLRQLQQFAHVTGHILDECKGIR